MELIYINNDPEIALYAQDCGVDRIMVDLEILGKRERQGNRDTVISEHTLQDIDKLRSVLKRSKLQIRVNPIHSESVNEINEVILRGADIIMLPMFKTKWEVEEFISIANRRARVCLLLETSQALVRVDDILRISGIDELYIGLNDLHLSMGLDFMFELLSGGIVDYVTTKIRRQGIPFGFGGISRIGTGIVDAKLVLSEHVRLGSTIAILSRAFHKGAKSLKELKSHIDLENEIIKLRTCLSYLSKLSDNELHNNSKEVSFVVSQFVDKIITARKAVTNLNPVAHFRE